MSPHPVLDGRRAEVPAEWTPRLRGDSSGGDGGAGVLLLNMGGPDRIESIHPFLRNLFSDRAIIRFPMPAWAQSVLARVIARARSKKLAASYRAMGGCSPQLIFTFRQAELLEAELRRERHLARVYVGMRYWKPFVRDAVRRMIDDGVRHAVVLPLYPHYSRATTGSSLGALSDAVGELGAKIKWEIVRSWETHPRYVEALSATVREALVAVAARGGQPPALLFSAHSLPVRFIEAGDPYLEGIQRTVRATVDALGWDGISRLAFQSRTGPVRWLTPSTPAALRALAREGHRRVVVVPVSFVSDHIETLEELDVQYRRLAESLGFADYVRTAALNTRPDFIAALASMVIERFPKPMGKAG